MVKHTPGPWTYQHENGENPRIVSPAIDPGTGKPCVVADLTCSMRAAGPVETSSEETEANCLIMAAAAEMLAALKESESDLMAYVDRLHKDGPRMAGSLGQARIRLENVRHAIAKAEGRANAD